MLIQLRIWRLGIKSLALHPMRSMLTVLGIFIGVASVVWLLAIGEGISREAQRQIEDLGATNIILRSRLPVDGSIASTTFYAKYGILREDVDALMEIPTVKNAIKIREANREAHYGAVTIDSHLVACTPEYADVMRLELIHGFPPGALDAANAVPEEDPGAIRWQRVVPMDDSRGQGSTPETDRVVSRGRGGSAVSQEGPHETGRHDQGQHGRAERHPSPAPDRPDVEHT